MNHVLLSLGKAHFTGCIPNATVAQLEIWQGTSDAGEENFQHVVRHIFTHDNKHN